MDRNSPTMPEPHIPLRLRFRAQWQPYAELLSYIKPYKKRFFIGVGMGVLYALINGSIPLLVKFVGDRIFPGGADSAGILHLLECLPDVMGQHASAE